MPTKFRPQSAKV